MLNQFTDFGRCVYIDNVAASYNATMSIIKQNKKNIACIIPDESTSDVWRDRLIGYKKALTESGLPYNPNMVVYENTFVVDESERLIRRLMSEMPIDGLVFSSDVQAYGGIKALKKMNIRIPEDVAIIGFDDLPYNTVVEPHLSSVMQPIVDLGKKGAEILLDTIENKDYSHCAIKFDTEVTIRESSHVSVNDSKTEEKASI